MISSSAFAGSVTSLKIINDFTVAGIANSIWVHKDGNTEEYPNVIPIGTAVRNIAFNENKTRMVVSGAKYVRTYSVTWDEMPKFDLLHKFETMTDWVLDVNWLNKGICDEFGATQVIMGFAHNFVQVWNGITGELNHHKQCPGHCILYSCSFFEESAERVVVTAGTVFNEIQLWNAFGSGEVEHKLKGHKGVIFRTHWHISGKAVLSTSDDRTVRRWDIDETGNWNLTWSSFGHKARVWDAAFISDKHVVTSSEDASIIVWNGETGARQCIVEGHQTKHAWRLAVHPNKPLFVTGAADRTVRRWDIDETGNWNLTWSSFGHKARVWDAAFISDKHVVTSSEDASIIVWNGETGARQCIVEGHQTKHAWRLAVHPNKPLFVTGAADGTVKYWDLRAQLASVGLDVGGENIKAVDLCVPDFEEMVKSGEIEEPELKKKKKKKAPEAVRCVRALPGGQFAFIASNKGRLWSADVTNNKWSLIHSICDADVKTIELVEESKPIAEEKDEKKMAEDIMPGHEEKPVKEKKNGNGANKKKSFKTKRMQRTGGSGLANGAFNCIRVIRDSTSGEMTCVTGDSAGYVTIISGCKYENGVIVKNSSSRVVRWLAHANTRVAHTFLWNPKQSVIDCDVTNTLATGLRIYSTGVDGSLKQWVLSGDGFGEALTVKLEAIYQVRTRLAFTSMAVLDNAICCAGSRGSVYCFPRCHSLDEGLTVTTYAASSFVYQPHGTEPVSAMTTHNGCLYSGGHDGSIWRYQVLEGVNSLPQLRLSFEHRALPITTVDRIWFSKDIDGNDRLMCLGFHSTTMYLLDLTSHYVFARVECGGWKRPYDLWCNNDSEASDNGYLLLFAPASAQRTALRRISTLELTSEPVINGPYSIRPLAHATTCTNVSWMTLGDHKLIVSGGEDNVVRVMECGENKMNLVSEMYGHCNGIRAVTAISIDERKSLICTSGGKELILCYIAELTSDNRMEFSVLCGFENLQAEQAQRTLSIDVRQWCENKYLLSCGNSEGTISMYQVNIESRSIVLIKTITELSRPVLTLQTLSINDENVAMFAGFTSGDVVAWDISKVLSSGPTSHIIPCKSGSGSQSDLRQRTVFEPALGNEFDVSHHMFIRDGSLEEISRGRDAHMILSIKIHQMGINSLHVNNYSIEESSIIRIASVGDDQYVNVTDVKYEVIEGSLKFAPLSQCSLQGSGASLEGNWSNGEYIVTAGAEQRVDLWKIGKNIENNKPTIDWVAGSFCSVADVQDLDAEINESEMRVVVVGQGSQILKISL
eukprot:TRINITY_DN1013_c0_g2_i1.p1 TRINITY_DN1013_c0_g2~~TRINITY_DN1013_c0_g2_i1.p1  ORF type:complete len:1271 (+),score=427.91 TRINITY_DN1013_c0_g2_i1:146-3958(+)